MADAWFTEVADELARCLTDARDCAEECERLLAAVAGLEDAALRRSVVDAVVGPAAVCRVLFELVDQPRPLVLAAARLCADTARDAADTLAALDGSVDVRAAIGALIGCAGSCRALLDA